MNGNRDRNRVIWPFPEHSWCVVNESSHIAGRGTDRVKMLSHGASEPSFVCE